MLSVSHLAHMPTILQAAVVEICWCHHNLPPKLPPPMQALYAAIFTLTEDGGSFWP